MKLEIEIKISAGTYGPTLAKTSLELDNDTMPEIPVAMLQSLLDGARTQALAKQAANIEAKNEE